MEPGTSSVMNSFISTGDDEKCPKLGMLFNTIDDAFDFYNAYARDVAFNVRKSLENKRIDPRNTKKFYLLEEISLFERRT